MKRTFLFLAVGIASSLSLAKDLKCEVIVTSTNQLVFSGRLSATNYISIGANQNINSKAFITIGEEAVGTVILTAFLDEKNTTVHIGEIKNKESYSPAIQAQGSNQSDVSLTLKDQNLKFSCKAILQ